MKAYLSANSPFQGATGANTQQTTTLSHSRSMTNQQQQTQLKRFNQALKGGAASQRRRTSTSHERKPRANVHDSNVARQKAEPPMQNASSSFIRGHTSRNKHQLMNRSTEQDLHRHPGNNTTQPRYLPPSIPKTPTEGVRGNIMGSFIVPAQHIQTQRDQQAYRSSKAPSQQQYMSSTPLTSKSSAQFTKATNFISTGASVNNKQQNARQSSQIRRKASVARSTTPRRDRTPVATVQTASIDEDANFRVCVRIRPLLEKEKVHVPQYRRKSNSIIQSFGPQNKQLLRVFDSDLMYDHLGVRDRSFAFHEVFNDQQTTAQVFDKSVKPLLAQLRQGYNATCFAYGMTGAGKTHTMFGQLKNKRGAKQGVPGIADLAVDELFRSGSEEQGRRPAITVSFLEIYNEQVKDLLWTQQTESNQGLQILEDPARGVLVQDLSEYEIEGVEDLRNIVRLGNERRTVAATGANLTSSRSHALLVFNIVTEHDEAGLQAAYKTVAKLQIVDLAGSERAGASDNRGQRMIEGANINKSLLALGNCINALTAPTKDMQKSNYVCYRDSKLTRLLKDSLGGNTKTVMLACVSQFFSSYEETMNTLKYAQRACQIKNEVSQNLIHQQRAFDAQQSEEAEVLIKQQTQMHQEESLRNQQMLEKYGSVIAQLQDQVSHLQTELTKKNKQEKERPSSVEVIQQEINAMPPMPTKSEAKTSERKAVGELSSDDWVMYECVKAAAMKETPTSGTSLRDFFANVHSKVTQNVGEKHLLAQKGTELKKALITKERQLEQTEQELRQTNQPEAKDEKVDAQLLSMKFNERQLLTQTINTNRHLLSQLEATQAINTAQYKQLRSYMGFNLPEVFSKVIGKMLEEEKEQNEMLTQQVQSLWTENQNKDRELKDIRSQMAKSQLSLHQLESKVSSDAIVMELSLMSQQPQQASNHQQQVQKVSQNVNNSSTINESRSISKTRSAKLGRYLSNPRVAPAEPVENGSNPVSRQPSRSRTPVVQPSIISTQQNAVNNESVVQKERGSDERFKMQRSSSRQQYIQAATPVSRVDLRQHVDQNVSASSMSQRQIAPRDSNVKDSKQKAPPIKEFRSYAQVRNESKQRMIDSARSGEAASNPDVDAMNINLNRLSSHRKDSSTNQALNSIEQELQRHREVDSQRRLIALKNHAQQSSSSITAHHHQQQQQPQQFKTNQPQPSASKLPNLIHDGQFKIEHEPRKSQQIYASAAKLTEEKNRQAQFRIQVGISVDQATEEVDQPTESKKVVKNFQLRAINQDVLQLRYQQRSAYMNDSEDEMTQMSCGMNLRETLRDGSDSYPASGRYLATEKKMSGAADQARPSDLSVGWIAGEYNADPSSKRVHAQLKDLGMHEYYDEEEPDFFTERDETNGRPSERLQGGTPFNEKIHDGDSTPMESNYELTTPLRLANDVLMTMENDGVRQPGMSFLSGIQQPSEPSEFAMNELEMQTTRKHLQPMLAMINNHHNSENILDGCSPRSDRLTCNVRSHNGSPKINQEAMRKVLGGHDLAKGNRISRKNNALQEATQMSPQVTNRTSEAGMQIQFFPQTTKNDPQKYGHHKEHSSQAWEDQSASALMTFAMDVCQENETWQLSKRQLQSTESKMVTERTVRVAHHAIRKGSIRTMSSGDQTIH